MQGYALECVRATSASADDSLAAALPLPWDDVIAGDQWADACESTLTLAGAQDGFCNGDLAPLYITPPHTPDDDCTAERCPSPEMLLDEVHAAASALSAEMPFDDEMLEFLDQLDAPLAAVDSPASSHSAAVDEDEAFRIEDFITLDQAALAQQNSQHEHASGEDESVSSEEVRQSDDDDYCPRRERLAAIAKAKRVRKTFGKKSRTDSEKAMRKRVQNRRAALKYRLKKNDEKREIDDVAGQLETKNQELKERVADLMKEIKYWRDFISELH